MSNELGLLRNRLRRKGFGSENQKRQRVACTCLTVANKWSNRVISFPISSGHGLILVWAYENVQLVQGVGLPRRNGLLQADASMVQESEALRHGSSECELMMKIRALRRRYGCSIPGIGRCLKGAPDQV
jgi:hypothetical protein